MVINIHAGHNAPNKVASGAVGYIDESEQARLVKNAVMGYLKQQGHTVYDCTCDNGTSVKDVLNKIVTQCNTHNVDIDVSIHFNAYERTKSDNQIKGTEVLVYSKKSKSVKYADRTLKAISQLGFTNRGLKERPDLTFLKKTDNPAMLIEVCFVDDEDDYMLYQNLGIQKIAKAITYGITGEKVPETIITNKITEVTDTAFRVKIACDVLNVRTGPGTKYPVKTEVKQGEVYTITEVSLNKWGKLLSGAGWINLKYTKKL